MGYFRQVGFLGDSNFMRIKFLPVLAVGSLLLATACTPVKPPTGAEYWQRVDADSALYMTGPKAQQILDQNIATCVREIDELVRLDAVRRTTPPDTHSEYHRALKASGDLAYYDTPVRDGKLKVDHKDFHDFESCMRSKGWERVKYIRYQVARQAQQTYKATQEIRDYGISGPAVEQMKQEKAQAVNSSYHNLNN